jgi:NADPH-dependent 2,4-dienoyl-CoA reductase/sulfur reductase-like enzyme/nitrite reductase/ring-hydroxylating ferredoxin subunit
MKTVRICSVNDLANGQMKAFEVEGRRILVSRIKDRFYATGAECPHYGAPLEEGLLTGGDRVYCPWHHACFHVCNGSLAEPPAREGLASYETAVEGDDVKVKLPDSTGGSPQPEMAGHRIGVDRTYVIVGGGAAGNAAAQALREEGFDGDIRLVSADDRLPYDRPNLSKAYLDGSAEPEWMPLGDEQFYKDLDINLELGERMAGLAPSSGTIHLQSGREIRYDRLLLATGGIPRELDLPGADLRNIFTLRSMADADAIIEAAEDGSVAVIIGGSFIGLECASSLRQRGLEVTVVERSKVPFRHVLGEEVGGLFAELHRGNGVDFRLEAEVERFRGEDSVEEVCLADGECLPAGLVIMGVGVRPATDFLSELKAERDGGLKVNEYMEAAPGIYAAGDIAWFRDLRSGQWQRIEHWRTAEQQGRMAARNMAGRPGVYQSVPFFWTNQAGTKLTYVGHAAQWDQIHLDGDLADETFLAFYLSGDRVAAVAGMGRGRDMLILEELMRVGRVPTSDQLRAGVGDFSEFLE